MNNNNIINEKENKIQEFFKDKIHDNMKLENNQYGCEFFHLFVTDFLRINEKKIRKEGFSCIKEYSNGPKANAVIQKINEQNFNRFFNNNYSWEQFIVDLMTFKKEIIKEQQKVTDSKTLATASILAERAGEGQPRTRPIALFTSTKFGSTFTQADKDYFFNKMYRDNQNNVYMTLDNKLLTLHFKPGTERTLLGNSLEKDLQFWPYFWKDYDELMEKWNKTIRDVLMTFDEDSPISIEEAIMNSGVPRIYLEFLQIQVTEKPIETIDDKGKVKIKYIPDNFNVILNNGNVANATNWTTNNKIEVFSKNLMNSVDVNKLKTIKRYTNDPNELAVHYLERPVAFDRGKVPEPPKTWLKFFGNGRFFDKKMDLLKIAHFIDNVLNANYDGRQTLVIGGQGGDGKGTFCNILQDIIGRDLTVTMNVADFNAEDRFGLAKIFNKKLLLIPDCKQVTTLFNQDKFKSVTGSDPVALENKGQKSFQFDTQGICMCITTNKSFYVNSEHGRTRVMPVMFKKNFDGKTALDKSVLYGMLLQEKKEFIQWCVDYKYWFKEHHPELFHGNSLVLCTDEDFESGAVKNEVYTEQELFQHVCEKQMLGNTKLCSYDKWTDEEREEMDGMAEVFNHILEYAFKAFEISLLDGKVERKDKLNVEDNAALYLDKLVEYGDGGEIWIKKTNLLRAVNAIIDEESRAKDKDTHFIPEIKSFRDKIAIRCNDKDWTKYLQENFDLRRQIYLDKKRLTDVVNLKPFLEKLNQKWDLNDIV